MCGNYCYWGVLMNKTVVFLHGAWMNPLCWDKFTGFFESRGYRCLAPAWPYKDQSVADLKRNPPAALGTLGITEIVDHYAKIIRELDEPPVLIGHSFGGLFVQMLLDRGLGSAGVAVDSAAPKGIFVLYWTTFRSNLHVLVKPGGWRKVLRVSRKDFNYAFIHTLPPDEQRAVYDNYVVPESGRIFFQAAFAPVNDIIKVNFKNGKRAPLLLIAGAEDRICRAAQIRANFKKYQGSPAVTEYKEFADRTHWIIGQPGWEEVASYAAYWLERLPAKDG